MAAQPWLRPAARAVIEAWLDPAASAGCRRARTAARVDRSRRGDVERSCEGVVRARRARDRRRWRCAPRRRRSRTTSACSRDSTKPHDPIARRRRPRRSTFTRPPRSSAALDAAAARRRAPDRSRIARRPPSSRSSSTAITPRFARAPASGCRPRIACTGCRSPSIATIVRGWLLDLAATGLPRLAFPGVTSADDLAAFSALFEELGHGDLSLLVKVGVQFGLYGGAIWALGTARHHARLAAIASGDELGCFAMSEVGHGSNVAAVETTARYDHATRELEIHTPGESARKEWIGGAAHDARWAVVFAQLEVAGERHGVHAVLVPIRTATGEPLPGVRTGDSGHKMGLNGVDNGRLWFEHVRVPVDNLLDRFASIDRDGAYGVADRSPGSPVLHDARHADRRPRLRRCRRGLGRARGARDRGALRRGAPSVRRRGRAPPARLSDASAPPAAAPRRHRAAARRVPRAPRAPRRGVRRRARRYARARGRGRRDEDPRQPPRDRRGAGRARGVRRAGLPLGQPHPRAPHRRRDLHDVRRRQHRARAARRQGAARRVSQAARDRRQSRRAARGRPSRRVRARRAVAPAPSRRSDRALQLAAFRFREEHLVETCAARIKKRLDDGVDGEDAILAVQEHVVAIAGSVRRAPRRRVVRRSENRRSRPRRPAVGSSATSRYSRGSSATPRGSSRPATSRPRARARSGARSRRCSRELAPHAREIVDAFGIPDACLAAPIAFFDPAHPTYPQK